MTCKEACSLLSDYMDGELNADTREDVDAHLKSCEPCAYELVQLQKSLSILKRLREKDAPQDYAGFEA